MNALHSSSFPNGYPMQLHFTKYHGLGNDFILTDARQTIWPSTLAEPGLARLARQLCDRHRGVGADGWLFVLPSRRGYCAMGLLNADGSIGEMCGNGMRCLARYL